MEPPSNAHDGGTVTTEHARLTLDVSVNRAAGGLVVMPKEPALSVLPEQMVMTLLDAVFAAIYEERVASAWFDPDPLPLPPPLVEYTYEYVFVVHVAEPTAA